MSKTDPREIVSDTGPLISLEKITGGYRFFRQLYDRVIIPPAVASELVFGQFESLEEYLHHYGAAGLVHVQAVSGQVEGQVSHLDEGEQQAIQLALELELPLLIEEEAGRGLSRQLGIHFSGIAGQLLKAVRSGVVSTSEGKSKLIDLRLAGRINRQVFDAVMTRMTHEV